MMNIHKNILVLLLNGHTLAICGFFELSGVLVNHGLIDQNIYFEIFNPTPFWKKAKPIIVGIRSKRSDSHYENFESLNSKRLGWKEKKDKKLLVKRKRDANFGSL